MTKTGVYGRDASALLSDIFRLCPIGDAEVGHGFPWPPDGLGAWPV